MTYDAFPLFPTSSRLLLPTLVTFSLSNATCQLSIPHSQSSKALAHFSHFPAALLLNFPLAERQASASDPCSSDTTETTLGFENDHK